MHPAIRADAMAQAALAMEIIVVAMRTSAAMATAVMAAATQSEMAIMAIMVAIMAAESREAPRGFITPALAVARTQVVA